MPRPLGRTRPLQDLAQRLGGAVELEAVRLPVPAGFIAEPVAAGLTAPVAAAADADGTLYLAEAGHPRRTPPRLLRLDPLTGIASVLATFETLPAPAALSLSCSDDAVHVASPGTAWRVRPSTGAAEPQPAAGTLFFLPGLLGAVWRGALYLCDAGTPAGAPGVGILWRVAPARWGPPRAAPPTNPRMSERRRRAIAALAAGGSVAVVALGLAWFYRQRRSRGAT